jgi:hypothetical protein
LKDKIEKIKDCIVVDRGFKGRARKHLTVSSFVEVKESSERYLMHYQIEQRNKDRVVAWITQCNISKYSAKKYEF